MIEYSSCNSVPFCFAAEDLRMSNATLHDVARKARVSAGTVSRVLHGHPAVSEENVAKVQQAIEALGYSPRQKKAAMSDLNPLENKNILLLTLGMDRSLAALPVIAAAIGGVEHAAARGAGQSFRRQPARGGSHSGIARSSPFRRRHHQGRLAR